LRHNGVTIPQDEYLSYLSPSEKFTFVDTSDALKPLPTDEEMKDFWSRKIGFRK
jgi:hypothetical protein